MKKFGLMAVIFVVLTLSAAQSSARYLWGGDMCNPCKED